MTPTQADRPVAVVTGAASGIGAALADALATRGYCVVGVDTAAKESAPSTVEPIVGDVADPRTWTAIVDRLSGRRIALLVNCAGVLLAGRLADCDADDIRRVYDVNLLGATLGCRALAPLLAEARRQPARAPFPVGMLNVASIFAPLSPPGFAAYNASKAGLVALTQTLAGEWAPAGLQATAVLPGVTKTALFRRGRYSGQSLATAVRQRGDDGRLTPEAVADTALRHYAAGRLVAPIGAAASRRLWLAKWLPGLVRRRIWAEANRVLDDA